MLVLPGADAQACRRVMESLLGAARLLSGELRLAPIVTSLSAACRTYASKELSGLDLSRAIAEIDRLLYEAKRQGRDRCIFAESGPA